MPDEFKNLALDAVDHNPESRPKLTTMFIVLSDCVNSSKFNTTIKNKIHSDEEAEALKADQDELNNYFEIAEIGVDNEDNKKKLLKNCRDFAS
ncbi:unnamed protein product [Rhizophagus irregularis]|nr:unnamed protein product [Rhizophagus irregularis]